MGDYGSEGFKRLLVGVGRTIMFPNRFSSSGVHAKEEGRRLGFPSTMNRLVALQNRQIQLAFVQCRRCGKSPLKAKVAKILLNISPPNLLSTHIISNQVAISKKEDNETTIGNGRWAGIGGTGIQLIVEAIASAGTVATPRITFPHDFT